MKSAAVTAGSTREQSLALGVFLSSSCRLEKGEMVNSVSDSGTLLMIMSADA